jgi:hypothetical protein
MSGGGAGSAGMGLPTGGFGMSPPAGPGAGAGLGGWTGGQNFNYPNLMSILGSYGGLGYGGLPGGMMAGFTPYGASDFGSSGQYSLPTTSAYTAPAQQQQTSSPTGSGTGYTTSMQSYNPSNFWGGQSWNQAVYVPYSGQHPQSSS